VCETPWLDRTTIIGGDDKRLAVLPQTKAQHFFGLSCAPLRKLFQHMCGEVNIATGARLRRLV